MSPVIAQILVAAVQSIMQAIEAKLSHEERVLLLIDPDELEGDEEQKALTLLTRRARLVRQFGKED